MNVRERFNKIFQAWFSPLVNPESTLLLFATLVFHVHYFAAHPAQKLLAHSGSMWIVYVYGGVVLLASLIKIPADWQNLTAFLVCIGSGFISIVYSAFFWMSASTSSWQELVVQLYYVLQAVISLIQIVLLVTREPGEPFAVTPRLANSSSALKTLAILTYVVGMTLLLDRVFALDPQAVTAQVNLGGVLILEGTARIRELFQHDTV